MGSFLAPNFRCQLPHPHGFPPKAQEAAFGCSMTSATQLTPQLGISRGQGALKQVLCPQQHQLLEMQVLGSHSPQTH